MTDNACCVDQKVVIAKQYKAKGIILINSNLNKCKNNTYSEMVVIEISEEDGMFIRDKYAESVRGYVKLNVYGL